MSITATYVSTTSFSVAADKAAEFTTGVRVKADCGVDGTKYGTVTSNGTTTVVITMDAGSLTSNLTSVLHGNDVPASLCHHGHTGVADGGSLTGVVLADCSVPFTGGHIEGSGAYTGFKFTETGVTANSGKWIYQVDAAQASLLAVNDAEDAFNPVWTADRTGATPSAFTINAWTSLAAGGGLGADFGCADYKLERPYFQDWAEVVNARGSISGAQTIDLELGNVVTATITAATTFTFSNPPATGRAGGFVLVLTNGGAGTITWPTAAKWAAGTAPTLTASGVDVLTFLTLDAGTTYRGILSSKDSK